jgi:5-methylcytosine-specific restriction endonuclease McrA
VHALPAWHDSEQRRRDRGVDPRTERRLREKVRRRAHGRCERCGRQQQAGEVFVVDHVVPAAEGGPTELGNLELLCPECDERKTRVDLARMRGQQAAPSR